MVSACFSKWIFCFYRTEEIHSSKNNKPNSMYIKYNDVLLLDKE